MNILRKAIKELNDAGYEFHRHGGNHDAYKNQATGKTIILKRHRDFNENDLRIIRKEIKENEGGIK